MDVVAHYAWFGAGLLLMTALTVGLGWWAGIGLRLFPLWAILRAVVQLSVIALLLRGILAVPWTVAGFVLLMLTTASLDRDRPDPRAVARPVRGRRRRARGAR